MKSKGPLINTPLALLFEYLEREGFSIGIGLRLKIQRVLHAFAKREEDFDLSHLKDYIRPLVVKSEKQQELFDHAFELYLHHINKETAEFKARILEDEPIDDEEEEEEDWEDTPKKSFVKRFWPAFAFFGLVGLLYIIQILRPAPSIELLSPKQTWVKLGESLMIEGSIDGFMVEDALQINGETVHGDRHINAEEKSFKYEHVYDSLKTYEFEFKGKNTLSFRDTVIAYKVAVCSDKPAIDFNYEIDRFEPGLVKLFPLIESDTARTYQLTVLADGKVLREGDFIQFSDSLMEYKFQNRKVQKIEMRIIDLKSSGDSICRVASKMKSINNDARLKGVIKELLIADIYNDSLVELDKTILEFDEGYSEPFDLKKPATWNALEKEEPYILIGIILLIVLIIPLCLEILYFRRRKAKLSKQVKRGLEYDGVNGPFELEFPRQNQRIKPEKDLFELSRMLKTRQESGTSRLDVAESIKHTARSAGFIDLQFKETTRLPEYLVIVDRKQSGGFHLELFSYLGDFLRNEDTLMEVFYFNNDMRYLSNEEYPHGISLEAVSEKFPEHVLLVISDGKNMINPKTDQVFEWAKQLVPKWEKKFLLTPRNYSEWDSTEDLLESYMPVLPASLDGMRLLSEEVFNETFPDERERAAELKLKTQQSFYSKEQLDAIEEYLDNPALFQWFCSLAIYPEIHWPLVLAIGEAILEHYSSPQAPLVLNYHNLHRISEVSHLLEGELDVDLRTALLSKLDPEAERIARKAVLDLLNEVDLDEDSYAYRELLVQKTLNRSLVYQNSETATQDLFYLWKNNLIEDPVSKKYIEGPKNLWEETAEVHFSQVDPKSWRQVLFPRGPIYLVLAATVLLLLNTSFFPKIFDKYTEPTPVRVNYSAQLNNYAIAKFDQRKDSAGIDSLNKAERLTSVVPEVPYNKEVLLFNSAINEYNNYRYSNAITRFEELTLSDSLGLEASHFIGLSHFYQGDLGAARERLNVILLDYPDYLEKFSPNIETLLEGESTEICDKYKGYTQENWRKEFIKEAVPDTWLVTIDEVFNGDLAEAQRLKRYYNDNYSNLAFEVLAMANEDNNEDPRYFIVIAQGILNESVAKEIKAYVDVCNFAFDYVQVIEAGEILSIDSDTSLGAAEETLDEETQKLCDKYLAYTNDQWRNNFYRRYVELDYNVVIDEFREVDGYTLDDVTSELYQFNNKFPNFYVDLYSITSQTDLNSREYYFLLARGISSKAEADEIAKFARECGIAENAYVKRGIKADANDDKETQKLCDRYSRYGNDLWFDDFFRGNPSDAGYHIVVAKFSELDGAQEVEARYNRTLFQSQHPDQHFSTFDVANESDPNYTDYLVLLGRGISSREQAEEILSFAQKCGIAENAYILPGSSYIKPKEESSTCSGDLNIVVRDAFTGRVLPNAVVTLLNTPEKVMPRLVSNDYGEVKFLELECREYFVNTSLDGYKSKEVSMEVPLGARTAYIDLEDNRSQSDIRYMLDIQPIYFDYDRFNIRPDAALELEKILAAMQQYPELKIDIEAHTDSRYDDKYAVKLSERMAESARDWLIAKGIDPARLTAKGFGETQLVNRCSNGVECSEEEHQLNRRAVFKIVD